MDILGAYHNHGNTYYYGDNGNAGALMENPLNGCNTRIHNALFPLITGNIQEMEEAAIQAQVVLFTDL